MKKVVVFRSELLPRSETFILEQIRALVEWVPILVGYRRAVDGLGLDGVDVRILPGFNAGRWQRWSLRICQLFGVAHSPTTRALRDLAPDLIHAHFGLDAVDIWPCARRLRIPILVTLHGFDISIYRTWWEAGHGGLHRRSYPRRLLSMANDPAVHFIAVSKAIKQCAIEQGIPEHKITVAYIGVDTTRFRPSGLPIAQRRKRILFVGRMVEKKAPLLMIRAFAEVRKQMPDAELVMIGAGPLLASAKELAEKLAVPVEFLGARTSNEVLAQLHEAMVFCLPSVTASNGDAEGLPISLLEAQACGIPCVTSESAGNRESILNGVTGKVVAENDEHELSNALEHMLTDGKLHSGVTNASTKNISNWFDLKRNSGELQALYQRALFHRK